MLTAHTGARAAAAAAAWSDPMCSAGVEAPINASMLLEGDGFWTIRARAFGARESEPRVASSRRPDECVSATSSRHEHQILHEPQRRPRKNPLYAVYNGLYTINLWGLIPQSVSESRRREEPQTSAPWTMPSIRFHGWWRRVPAASLAGLRAQRLGPGPLPYTHRSV